MLRRNLGFEREIELAQAAALAPFAQMLSDGTNCGLHGRENSAAATALPITSELIDAAPA
jgi:hypothetical protein